MRSGKGETHCLPATGFSERPTSTWTLTLHILPAHNLPFNYSHHILDASQFAAAAEARAETLRCYTTYTRELITLGAHIVLLDPRTDAAAKGGYSDGLFGDFGDAAKVPARANWQRRKASTLQAAMHIRRGGKVGLIPGSLALQVFDIDSAPIADGGDIESYIDDLAGFTSDFLTQYPPILYTPTNRGGHAFYQRPAGYACKSKFAWTPDGGVELDAGAECNADIDVHSRPFLYGDAFSDTGYILLRYDTPRLLISALRDLLQQGLDKPPPTPPPISAHAEPDVWRIARDDAHLQPAFEVFDLSGDVETDCKRAVAYVRSNAWVGNRNRAVFDAMRPCAYQWHLDGKPLRPLLHRLAETLYDAVPKPAGYSLAEAYKSARSIEKFCETKFTRSPLKVYTDAQLATRRANGGRKRWRNYRRKMFDRDLTIARLLERGYSESQCVAEYNAIVAIRKLTDAPPVTRSIVRGVKPRMRELLLVDGEWRTRKALKYVRRQGEPRRRDVSAYRRNRNADDGKPAGLPNGVAVANAVAQTRVRKKAAAPPYRLIPPLDGVLQPQVILPISPNSDDDGRLQP